MKRIYTLLSVILTAASGIVAQIPTNGLVAAYSFKGSGAITNDSYTGTYPLINPLNVNNVAGFQGGSDSSASFSGNNFMQVNNAAFRTGSMSVSAWFKFGSLQAYSTIAVVRYNDVSAPYNSWNIYTGSNVGGGLAFTLKTSGSSETTISGSTVLTAGSWYLATATYDATTGIAKLYLNGALEATSSVLSGPIEYNPSNNPMVIGNVAGTPNNGFVGSIDELLYYNRALNATEIADIILAQNSSPYIVEPVAPLRKFEEARVNFNGYGRDHAYKRVNAGQNVMASGSSVVYTTDRFNNPIGALSSSNTSYVMATSATAHAGMDTALTVMGWVNRSSSDQYGLFVNKRYSNSAAPFNSYALGCGSGYTGYTNALMGSISTSDTSDIMIGDNTVITNGSWYFVAMTYSAGEQKLKFYVNNTLVETKTVTGTLMQNNAAPLYVGRGYPTSLHDFNGAVDDIRIFSKALNVSEIDSIRNLMPNTGAGLVSYYPMGYYPHDAVSGFDLGYNGNQTTDRFGSNGHATSFGGSNYIVPDYSPLHKSDTAITLEGWIYRTSEQLYSTMAGIRLNQSVAPFNSVLLAAGSGSGGKLLGVISTVNNPDVNIMSPNALPSNVWIHVGITYSAAQSKIKLYLNGMKVNEVSASGNINYGNSGYRLTIGNASANPLANHYFIGKIDEVKLYNYAKTEAEFSSDLCIIAEPSVTSSLYACAYSPVINLMGAPAGGSFSGPGISGTTFDPAAMGVGLHPVSYYVETNGCMKTAATNITVSGNPNMTITDDGTTLSTAFTTPIASPSSMQWIDCSTGIGISGAVWTNYTPTASGDYAVVANQNGCMDTSSCINFVYSPVSLNELSERGTKVYPNPVQDKLNIQLIEATNQVTLANALGEMIFIQHYSQGNNTVDVSMLPNGIYFLSIENEKNKTIEKIIINH